MNKELNKFIEKQNKLINEEKEKRIQILNLGVDLQNYEIKYSNIAEACLKKLKEDYSDYYEFINNNNMTINYKNFIIEQLTLLQEASNKFSELYKLGIDLANYDNNYVTVAIESLSKLTNIDVSILEWWIFESSSKIVIFEEKEYNLEKPEQFLLFETQN